MVQTAETVFRDFVTDGVPASGPHKVKKAEARELLTYLERGVLGGAAGSAVFASKASMDATLTFGANTMAWVIGDSTAANNGIYQKSGASGSGSWTRRGDLPYSFIKASDAGAGTPNAIKATTSLPIPSGGGALIALNIFQANTASPVTVAFNGGSALTVKTSSGNDVSAGGLTAGMMVAGYVSGSTFRLLSDQASAAIVAAAEAAADRAEQAVATVAQRAFKAKSAFAVATIDSAVDVIQLDGYTSAGDGGGALYKRVAAEPTHPLKAQSADGAWWEIAETEVNIRMSGAIGDGQTHPLSERYATLAEAQAAYPHASVLTQSIDWAAIQSAINWAKTRAATVLIPDGKFAVNEEIDFAGITTQMTVKGMGGFRQSIIYALPFGAGKKLFKGANPDTNTRPMEGCMFRDFEIQGRNATNTTMFQSADAPIGIYLPYSSADRIVNVVARGLGNTPFWTCSANNTRISGAQALGCGYHFTKDDALSTGALMSGTTGSTTITADAAVFNSGHVGKIIHIQGAGTEGFPKGFAIQSVGGDGLTCVVDQPPSRNFTGGRATLEGVACNAVNGNEWVTLDTGILRPEDIGRMIYIEGAGSSGRVLVTTIVSVAGTTQARLANPPLTTISGAFVHLTPAFYAGLLSKNLSDTRGLNDIILTECVVESCYSVDYFMGPGVNIAMNNCKSHGMGTGGVTRPGRNVRNMIFDSARSLQCRGSEFDYGYCKDGGNILICGEQGSVSLSDFMAGSITEGQSFIDLRSITADTTLAVGAGHYNKSASKEPGFIKFTAPMSWSNVSFSDIIRSRQVAQRYDFSGPSLASAFATYRTSLADDAIIEWVPPFTVGILKIWTDAANENGDIYTRTTASPSVRSISGGSDIATGTTVLTTGTSDGTDGKLNVAAVNGKIIIKNRMGASRSVRWAFFA